MIHLERVIPVSDIRTVTIRGDVNERRVATFEMEEETKDEKTTFTRLEGFDRIAEVFNFLGVFLNVQKAFEEKK